MVVQNLSEILTDDVIVNPDGPRGTKNIRVWTVVFFLPVGLGSRVHGHIQFLNIAKIIRVGFL